MARCSGQASAGRESWAPSWTQIAYSKELLASFSAVGPGVNLLGHPAVHTYNRAKAVQIRVCAHAHAHKHIVLCPHTHKVFTGKGPPLYPQLSEFFGFWDAEEGQHPFFSVRVLQTSVSHPSCPQQHDPPPCRALLPEAQRAWPQQWGGEEVTHVPFPPPRLPRVILSHPPTLAPTQDWVPPAPPPSFSPSS